jgi:hypothetical protein
MKRSIFGLNCKWAVVVVAAVFAVPQQIKAENITKATVMIQADAAGIKISPDLFGIFFEDINYAADGGLYAELVQNRSFEYNASESKGWNALTAWQLVTPDDGKASVAVATDEPRFWLAWPPDLFSARGLLRMETFARRAALPS